MRNSVPRTALPGRSWSSHDALARGLGSFSIALGVLELVAPRALCRAIGLDGRETVVRTYGAREIATGVAILASHDATSAREGNRGGLVAFKKERGEPLHQGTAPLQ